jgi:hypothetical protein
VTEEVHFADVGRTQNFQTCVHHRPAFRFAGAAAPLDDSGEMMVLWSGRLNKVTANLIKSKTGDSLDLLTDNFEFAYQNLGTDSQSYSVAIDCNVKDIVDEGTNNTITATFYSASGRVIGVGEEVGVVGGVFGCELEDLDIYATTRGGVDHVVISTDGSDGFMIDKIELRKENKVIREYGTNDNQGWCLSNDSTDASRSWKFAAIDGKCTPEKRFSYSAPRAKPKTNYSVIIDCDVTGIDDEATKDRITATFYSQSKEVIGSGVATKIRDGVLGCGGARDVTISAVTNGPAASVTISTDGSDGFMIDRIKLKKDGDVKKTFGASNDKGWCLSTDPSDGARSWKGYAVNNTCTRSISWNY